MNRNWLERIFSPGRPDRLPVRCSPEIHEWRAEYRRSSIVFSGDFAVYRPGGVALCRFPGRIVVWPGQPTDVYIYNPPAEIRSLPEGPCFQLVSPGEMWFKLHWERPACTFEESRAHVERILNLLSARVLLRRA
jgi:hypothetical protein